MKLILASGSPRRLELLSQFGFPIEVVKSTVDEIVDEKLSAEEVAVDLALQKGREVSGKLGTENPVLSADTIVVMEDSILGKPKDKIDAVKMMHLLSGRTHRVITGVSIFFNDKVDSFFVSTDVTFKHLSEKEIEDYTNSDEPYDKAGAYAIQGLGSFMVKFICGSHSNVIGLPVAEVIRHLQKIGFLEGIKR